MNGDLTVGKPEAVLWKFCLPLFGSILFQQLYNIADSLVAGKFIGESALAAVGNGYEVTLIFIAFAMGCNIGCSVIVSQFFGAKNYTEMKTAVSTAMIASGVLCAALMLAGLPGCGRLLALIHTPEDLLRDSRTYLNIYILGLPFVFFYNIATGVFSAMGDSRTPFIFLAFSSISNIAVDILFVKAFRMGVPGVAWATFLCQGVSCVLAVAAVLARLRKIRTDRRPRLFSAAALKRIARIAIPSTLQQSFVSVGNIILQGVINGFGVGVMAGYSAGVKLNNLVITSLTTIGNGISNYTAQNVGAQKPARIREGFRAGLRMVWLLCVPMALLYILAGRRLLNFFIDEPTTEAIRSGLRYLRILAPFYFVVSAKLVADGVLRGFGRMYQFMITTFTDLILRVALAALLSGTALGSTGIWCAWPIGWSIATVLSVYFCRAALADSEGYGQGSQEGEADAAECGQDTAAAGLPVVTLTLNPCIDRTIRVPNLECGGTNRVTDAREDVAGKGINVSIALRQLGVETVCLGFSYSEDAARLERALEERGIAHDFVAVDGKLRMNLKVFDESQRVMTEFNERGGRVPAEAVDLLLAKVDRYLDRAALIVLTGSVPEGVPNGIYGTIIRMAHKKGVRAVLDASGALLAEGLREKPFLIKPNRDEFMGLFGEELAAGKRVEEIAREVVAQGVDYVCVSMGAEGCLLVGADGALAADAPDVEVRGIQGAGDSLVAGMCAALARRGAGAPAQSELLRCAVAAAGASLMRPGTQMCTREDFLALYDRVKIRLVQ